MSYLIYEENSFRKIVIDLLANQNMLSGKNHIKTRLNDCFICIKLIVIKQKITRKNKENVTQLSERQKFLTSNSTYKQLCHK